MWLCKCSDLVRSIFMLSVSLKWYDFLLRPRILFALLTCLSTCLEIFSSLATKILLYSISHTPNVTFSHAPCVYNFKVFYHRWNALHFSTSSHGCQLTAQSTILSTFCCNLPAHSFSTLAKNICVSFIHSAWNVYKGR